MFPGRFRDAHNLRPTNSGIGNVASEAKPGRLKQLMDTGKEKGYVLYDEVNELLTEDYQGTGRDLDDMLSELD